MSMQKSRWSKTYEAGEEELVQFLQSTHPTLPERISLLDQETLEFHPTTETTIWCADGSLTISYGSQHIALQVGDTIIIEGNKEYSILSGFTGCVYYQESNS